MRRSAGKRIVVLGMMSKHPVAGVVWQTVHYLVGFQRLGHDVYYVEAGGFQPSWLLAQDVMGDRSVRAAAFIDAVLRRFDLGDRWAFHALHSDGRCYGLSEARLHELYRSADLLINLHGATIPRPEHSATDRLVFLETDPGAVQVALDRDRGATTERLASHVAFFTFGENCGSPDCKLPEAETFHFKPTRQPVVLDLWERDATVCGKAFTTIGNWRQVDRDLVLEGELYYWSKHYEYLKFLDLPQRTHKDFELALTGYDEEDQRLLEAHSWRVRNALEFSMDLDLYRDYITGSRGEFTVAKDRNVRLRSGWFSDRSATYLAAGRPVITQETGFSNVLPTGQGLFAFSTMEEIVQAVETIDADYARQCRTASMLAREYFNYDVVLTRLLAEVGV